MGSVILTLVRVNGRPFFLPLTPQRDPIIMESLTNKSVEEQQVVLKKLFNDFENECIYEKRLRSETIRGYRSTFDLFLRVMPEVVDLEFITHEMLIEFFKRLEKRKRLVGKDTIKSGVKNSTIKTYWHKLDVFFKWLVQKEYLETNPFEGKKPVRVSYDDYRRLKDSDVYKIYSSIMLYSKNSFILRRDTMMVSLLLYTGIRKGEFISLQIRDIDLEKHEITIRGETSKSKRTRILKINPTLLMHLKEYFKERNLRRIKSEFLIASSNDDRALSRDGLKHWVKSLVKKSGVRFHLHMFRHTFACKLCESNTNPFKVQKMMGHTDIKMTMKYTRSMKTEDMAEDIDKISF